MNVILSIAKYTNNHMKLNWSNYDLSDSFDEYISSKKSVKTYKKNGNFFESLSSKEMEELDLATKAAIKSLGINFRVYSEGESSERTWPLDFIPRIIKKRVGFSFKGLKQRTKALNLFIEDCYNN